MVGGTMTPKEVIEFAKKHDVKFVDMKFIDFPGVWQHTTIPVGRLEESLFEDGIAFDGSSIRGWQPINASDMIMIPDPTTARLDPFYAIPTLSLTNSIFDPITKQPYSRDPRHIAKKAEAYLRQSGIGDTSYMGPEAEFFVFDDVRFDQSQPNAGYYHLDSVEGAWNSGREEFPNLGYKTRHKEGYFPVPPTDTLGDFRQSLMTTLMESGVEVEVGHHEVASGGQCEIGLKFKKLMESADQLLWFKYVVKNHARKHGKTHVHAQAALRRQRQRHARASVDLEGGQAPLRRRQLRRPVGHGALLHRRHHQARQVDRGVHQPDDQLVPPPRAWLRGAGQPGVLEPQPLGQLPHPHHGAQPQDPPRRGSLPRPELQPLPCLRRHADGRHRRDPEQDPPGRSDGQGHLRSVARGAEGHPAHAGQPRRVARLRGARPRVF